VTIKVKLILAVVGSVVVSILGLSGVVVVNINEYARNDFDQSSATELHLVQNYVDQFISETTRNVEGISSSDSARGSRGFLPVYTDATSEGIAKREDLDPRARGLFDVLVAMQKSHPSYDAFFLGFDDGGMLLVPESPLPPGYDPRIRPWYTEAMASDQDSILTKAYLSTTKEVVASIVSKVRDNGGVVGAMGIDINLSSLTAVLADLRIGQSGYLMVMEADGTILSDPRHEQFYFKKASETGEPALEALAAMTEGVTSLTLDGTRRLARIQVSEKTGWKIALIMDEDEIFSSARSVVRLIALLGLVLGALLAGLGVFLARGIARPIGLLADAAAEVAQGRYDAVPEERKFSGELLVLNRAMRAMVDGLARNITLAESKSQEAAEQTRKAEIALREAEEARIHAEQAKQAGMLHAAGQLEGIVGSATSATHELNAQIEASSQGADLQRERTTEAATAMEQMNASVLEVAKNASQAAENAEVARDKAVEGFSVVDSVISSISKVRQETERMEAGLGRLGAQADDIGVIINVIDDIADQTNLLALNAAIEAARAGDAGRGFAVVADEVRKLAEKTMSATKQVGEAITAIQSGTRDNISGMATAASHVQESTTLANAAGEALRVIKDIVETTADQVRNIATASEEQSAASEEITRSTEEVNRIAAETAVAMTQSAQAMADLAKTVERLQQVIQELKSS